ncbi:trifunctional dihydropteroate synthetase [Maudiozyma exigua]|uniref:Folic acid synthesis protein fol1 n=1 Tax=Maudiozyma exigua TaxID=34358 RepID=A0A9P6WAQ6_MAUEX|nr:trifunctional dihydropteroate synthetase [Kazachstania exigua]
MDHIHINNLAIQTICGPDLWHRLAPQHCKISLTIDTDFSKCSSTDDLKHSLNYAVLCRDITSHVNSKNDWKHIHSLSGSIYQHLQNKYQQSIESMEVIVKNEDCHLRTKNIESIAKEPHHSVLQINDLEVFAIIGIFTFERLQRQKVSLNITVQTQKSESQQQINIGPIVDNVIAYVEQSDFKTVEALIESVSKTVEQSIELSGRGRDLLDVSVKVTKLSAITDTDGVGVSCVRNVTQLQEMKTIEIPTITSNPANKQLYNNINDAGQPRITTCINEKWAKAYLAFGSNVGDRMDYILQALSLLKSESHVRVINISSVFESEPMYFKDQNPFLNGCIEISTTLIPTDLLKLCKRIEYLDLKRTKDFDNGPRSIDLDIILYFDANGNSIQVNESDLIVPHPRMLERTFVLEPLCELIPPLVTHPLSAEPIVDHLQQLYDEQRPEDILWKVIPLRNIPGSNKERFLKYKTVTQYDDLTGTSQRVTVSPTTMMAIMNTTPDSFSDGSTDNTDVDILLKRVETICNDVLNHYENVIIDIGGCSTRPNSVQPTTEEELIRTIFLIKAIRSHPTIPQEKVILSIDTYRGKVAQQAIEAGVDIINDISGGNFDDTLFEIVAQYPKVAYVLSHIRGDITTMTKCASYDLNSEYNPPESCIDYLNTKPCDTGSKKYNLSRIIGGELSVRYKKAIDASVLRSQLILDPGIGFAKNLKENLSVIKQLPLLKNYSLYDDSDQRYVNFRNIPVLLGPSRKKFIGTVTKEDIPENRDFATGSVVASSIGFGADIVRVHNVRDCVKSAVLADALYKSI